MPSTISVNQALQKARSTILYPIIFIILVPPIASCAITSYYNFPLFIPVIVFIFSFSAGWLYWWLTVVKWQLWAFENVRNVHELKRRAIQQGIIWPDNQVMNKPLSMSAANKEKWAQLQQKFKQPDIFINDTIIPEETLIYFSKKKSYYSTLSLAVTVFAIFAYIASPSVYMLLVFIIPFLLMLFLVGHAIYISYKIAQNRQPQILLNEKGIHTCNTIFYSWADIKNEAVISDGEGRRPSYELVYDYPNGSERLNIDAYHIAAPTLEKLLYIYRGRFEQKQKDNSNAAFK